MLKFRLGTGRRDAPRFFCLRGWPCVDNWGFLLITMVDAGGKYPACGAYVPWLRCAILMSLVAILLAFMEANLTVC